MSDSICVGIIPKNKSEEVHVSLSEFKGHKNFDVRVFYMADNDEVKPTPKGVSLSIEKLDALIVELVETKKRAQRMGWLKESQESWELRHSGI